MADGEGRSASLLESRRVGLAESGCHRLALMTLWLVNLEPSSFMWGDDAMNVLTY